MAENPGILQSSIWPLPAYYFKVEIDGSQIMFQKVSGLEVKTNFVTYAHGNMNQPSNMNIAGRTVYEDVTLEKGYFVGNSDLYDWWKMNLSVAEKKTVVIKLMSRDGSDENDREFPEITWTLSEAMQVQLTFPEMDSTNGSTPAIEKLVIRFNSMDVNIAPE